MTRVEQAFVEKFDKATWRTWRFDELVENIVERVVPKESGLKKYFGLEHLDTGSLHISRWGDPESLGGDKLKIYEGDLIFAKRNAYLKRVAIADCDAVASAHSMVLRAKLGAINPSFLPFFLLSDYFWSRAIKISVGSLSPTINWKTLAKQEFLLPPKEQQAEIAELLWALDEVRELRLSLRRSIKIMMNVEFTEFTSRGKGEIVEFSSIFELTKEKSKSPLSMNRYVGLEHIKPGSFSISTWGNSSSVKGDATILLAGDVGYSKLRPYLDKAFIADFDCVASTEVLNLRPIGVAPRTLLQILHSAQFLKFISDKGYGTKMPRVNEKIIGSYRLRLPADEDALLVRVDSYQNLLSEISMSLRSSHDLSSSLINKVFNHV